MTTSGIVVRTWNDAPITRRDSDGFADATGMCEANGKRWFDYHRSDRTADYIEALTETTGLSRDELIISTTTGPNHLRGTWVHPRLAVDLARWISPQFAVWMDGWFLEQLDAATAATGSAFTAEDIARIASEAVAATLSAQRPPRQHRRHRKVGISQPQPEGSAHLHLMARIHAIAVSHGAPIGWADLQRQLSHNAREALEPNQYLAAIRDLAHVGAGHVKGGPRGALRYQAIPHTPGQYESFPSSLDLIDFPFAS